MELCTMKETGFFVSTSVRVRILDDEIMQWHSRMIDARFPITLFPTIYTLSDFLIRRGRNERFCLAPQFTLSFDRDALLTYSDNRKEGYYLYMEQLKPIRSFLWLKYRDQLQYGVHLLNNLGVKYGSDAGV